MAIVCAISVENQKKFKKSLANVLAGYMAANEPLDIKAISKDVHSQIEEIYKDMPDQKIKALSYVMLIPDSIMELAIASKSSDNKALKEYLTNNVNLKNISDLSEYFKKSFDNIANYVGNEQEEYENLENNVEILLSASLSGNVENFKVSNGVAINNKSIFNASIPSVFKTAVGNVISSKEGTEGFNVERPSTAYISNIKKMLIEKVNSGSVKEDTAVLPEVGPVFLAPITLETLNNISTNYPQEVKDYIVKTGVGMVMIDIEGNPVYFDKNLNASITNTSGKLFVDSMPEVTDVVKKRSLELYQKKYNATPVEAQGLLDAELKRMEDIRTFIQNNPQTILKLNIKGGKSGYAHFDFKISNPVNSINFGQDEFLPEIATQDIAEENISKGKMYFRLSSLPGIPIEIERVTIAPSFATKIATLLTTDLKVMKKGYPVKAPDSFRKLVSSYYLNTNSNDFSVNYDPETQKLSITVLGQMVNLSDRKKAFNTINTYLTTLGPKRRLEEADAMARKERGARVINREEIRQTKLQVGDIIRTQQGENVVYDVVEYPKLQFSKEALQKGYYEFDLEPDMDGHILKLSKKDTDDYKEFIKENSYIHYQLNAEKKVVSMNPYLTFDVPQESLDMLYPPVDTSKDIKAEPEIGDTDYDYLADWDELPKTVRENLERNGITREKLEEARVWYENSEYNKVAPFKVFFDQINAKNPNDVATFTKSAVTLWKGSDFSDLYHEAWHVFTRTFLKPEQLKALFDELKTKHKNKTFTDYKGNKVKFGNATYKQIDEYLAEDFREYMLNGGKPKSGFEKRNTLFRYLARIVKAIAQKLGFNTSMFDERNNEPIYELYNKIRVGNVNELTMQQENPGFYFAKTLEATDPENPVQALNTEASNAFLQATDYYIADYMDTMNQKLSPELSDVYNALKTRIDNGETLSADEQLTYQRLNKKINGYFTTMDLLKPEGIKNAYKHVKRNFVRLHNQYANDLNAIKDEVSGLTYGEIKAKIDAKTPLTFGDKRTLVNIINSQEFKIKKKQVDYFYWAIQNFGDTENIKKNKKFKGIIGYHFNKSDYISKQIIENVEKELQTQQDKEDFKGFENIGNEDSAINMLPKEIMYLLKGLTRYDSKGNVDVNPLTGVPKLVEYKKVANKLFNLLAGVTTPQQMADIIKKEQKNYPAFKQLLGRLGRTDVFDKEGEYQMWSKFFMGMNLTRRSPKVVNLNKVQEKNENGTVTSETFDINVGGSPNMDIEFTVSRWKLNIQNLDLEGYKEDRYGKLMGFDELKKLILKYPAIDNTNSFEFLKALGIVIPDAAKENSLDLKEITRRTSFIYSKLRNAYFYHLNKDVDYTFNPIRDLESIIKPFSTEINELNKDLGTDIRKIADIANKYSESVSNFMYTSATLNQQYELTKNSTITQKLNGINNAEDFNALVSKPETSHYSAGRNFFVKRSIHFNTIFNLDAVNGPKRVYASTGLQEKVKGEGRPIDITINDFNGVVSLVNNVATEFGEVSSGLDDFGKFMADFYASLGGITELPRHADKSSYSSVMLRLYRVGNRVRNKYTEAKDLIHHNDLRLADYKKLIYLENKIANKETLTIEEQTTLNNLESNMPDIEEFNFIFEKVIMQYLLGEYERMMAFRQMQQDYDNRPDDSSMEMDFAYLKRGQNFVIFDDIISPQTKEKIETLSKELIKTNTSLDEYFMDNPKADLKFDIMSDFRHYFENLTNETIDTFINIKGKLEFVSPKMIKELRKAYSDEQKVAIKGDRNDVVLRGMARAFNLMTFISNMESNIMFYGDPAQYDDYTKRIALQGSAGIVPRNDSVAHEHINQKGRLYAKSKGFADKYPKYEGILRTGIFQDVKMKSIYFDEFLDILKNSELKKLKKSSKTKGLKKAELENMALKNAQEILEPYTKMTEADGQAWITFDTYRYLLDSYGMWPQEMEDLYQSIVNGTFDSEMDIMSFFPVLKLQYSGPVYHPSAAIETAHKYSLFPLIPPVIEGRNLKDLHDRLMNQGLDYAVLSSGAKVGVISKNGSIDKIYENYSIDQDERTPLGINEPVTTNEIYVPYLKYQTHIEPSYKGKVTLPTQMRTLVLSDLFERGVPVDFKTSITDKDERRLLWDKLSDKQKSKESKIYNNEAKYLKDLQDLVDARKKKLLRKISFKEVDGRIEGPMDKLLEFVEKELERQELSQEDIDFITQMREGKFKDLSLSVHAEKMERLLNAIIIKEIGKPKVKGEGLIQVSNMLFEKKESWTEARKGLSKSGKYDVYGSNDYPFYRADVDKKGNITKVHLMKIGIAMQGDFKLLLKDEDVLALAKAEGIIPLEALNKLIKDEEWLNKNDNRRKITLTGPRIPSQKQNSLEAAEVYEFFPEAAGNIVVLPSEIVAKSGGDFDVDKLFMLMPHLAIRKGKVELYKTLSRKELEKFYLQYKLAKTANYETPNALADAMSKALGIDYNELIVEVDIDEMFDFLLTEEKAMTFEQFEEFMVGSKGPENELIKSFVDLLTLPEAFVSLITPNSTRMLEPLSKELEPYNSKVNVKRSAWSNSPLEKMSMTRVLEAGNNRFAHTNNSVGKSTLGIGAVDNRWSPLFNEVGMYLNQGFYDYKGRYHRIVSKLNHNVTIINGVEHISISDIDDVFNEENIGDKLSEKINGWVDVAKNPWIFYIRGNKIAAPVLLFLTQIGTPARETVYFASQPMIREYVEEIERSRSVFAEAIGTQSNLGPSGAVFEARKRMIKKYEEFFLPGIDERRARLLVMEKFKNLRTTDIMSATESLTEQFEEAFDPNYLEQNVNNNEFNMNDFAQLLHYFELEDYANQTKNVKLKLNFDTAKASSLFTAMQRKNFINEVKDSDFFPAHLIDKLVNNTPLAPFAVQDFQIKLLGRLFPVRNNDELNSYLESFYTDNKLKNKLYNIYPEQEDLVNTFKNDFMNFLFQTKLKDFNLNKLQFYNGLDVTTEIKEAPGLDISAVVMEVKGVKQMYVNSQRINREFKSMYYNKPAYEAMGNATVPVGAFSDISEYQQFVLERAMLTDRYPMDKVLDRIDYKIKLKGNLQFSRPTREESNEQYMDRITLKTYREWLRDMALFNTNNVWHLFKSPNNYAITYQKFIETVPELENYSIKEGLRVTPKGNDGINNIVVRDPSMDIDTEQLYKDNIASLSNYSAEITGDKETDDILAHFFRKMPIVAMFQTGYNMKGMYNITRLVPKDGIYEVVDTAAKQFLELTADEKTQVIDTFRRRWFRENDPASRYTARAKVKDFSKASPTEKSNVQNALDNILGEYGNTNIGTYDVTKINKVDAVDAILKETPNDLYVYEQAYNQMDSGGMGWVFSKSLQQNKIGIETRLLFNVTDAAKYKDIKNSDGTSSPNPELVKNVDLFIEKVLKEGQGKKLRFPTQGIGQYMVGLDEVSQRREKDPVTKYDMNKAVAPLSFQYLSEQLFKHFQYVNPNSLDINIPAVSINKIITIPIVEVTAATVPVRLNEKNQIEVDSEMIDKLFEEKAYTKEMKAMDGSVLPGLPAGTFNNSDEYSEYLIYREKAKKYVTRKQGMTDAQYFEALRQESLKQTNQQRTAIPEANNPINAGTMNMNVGMVTAGQAKPGFFRKELMDKKITSTWYAVVSGLRTQTTRINQAINYNVGDYIYFTNTFFQGANSLKGKKLVVKVTNIINKSVKELLAEDPNYAETWSKNEGWTPGYIKDNPNVLSKYPVQFEYVGIQNEDGTWQNIDKKYTVAPTTTEIQMPVTEVIPSEKIGIRPMIVEMVHPDVTNDMVLQKLKFCGIFGR